MHEGKICTKELMVAKGVTKQFSSVEINNGSSNYVHPTVRHSPKGSNNGNSVPWGQWWHSAEGKNMKRGDGMKQKEV
jgi:hypothetical protein